MRFEIKRRVRKRFDLETALRIGGAVHRDVPTADGHAHLDVRHQQRRIRREMRRTRIRGNICD